MGSLGVGAQLDGSGLVVGSVMSMTVYSTHVLALAATPLMRYFTLVKRVP